MQQNQSTRKGLIVWVPLVLSVVLAIGMIIGMLLQTSTPTIRVIDQEQLPANYLGTGKVEELIRYIEAKYVDEVDREKMVDEAIAEVLDQLDPHSTYLSAKRVQEEKERLEGNFDGIGVEFIVLDDTVRVVTPLSGGPSEQVGLLPGDMIVEIGDSTVAGVDKPTSEIVDMLRGKKGTEVEIGIKRKGDHELYHYTITRDEIPMYSVDVAYMLDDVTGYIKVNRFSSTTSTEFIEGVKQMVEEEGLKDLVIDLRQNPGGYLREATEMLSQLFLEKDLLLVYTQGRSVNRLEYKSTGRVLFDVQDIVVLIDEGSASASEIVAGAIQDHDRGAIVGRRSFGKGLVQEQYSLRDGSAIRLTVARYYTPSGRSIQRPYEDRNSYRMEVMERHQNGELFNPDSIQQEDSTIYYTSGGRVVYGGGGITPDVFVPLDTNYFNDAYITLRPYLAQYVFSRMDTMRKQFEDKSLQTFLTEFNAGEEEFNGLVAFAEERRDAEVDPAGLTQAAPRLAVLLKAEIARHLYDNLGYYSVMNRVDDDVQKALQVLKHPNPLTFK